jgi:hypothetical protein
VRFDYLPGCCGYGSPRSAFSRRRLLPAVIAVTEVVGYFRLLMNIWSSTRKRRGVWRAFHSSLATSHSMMRAAPVATRTPPKSTMRDSSKPIPGERRADSNRLPLLQLRVISQALQGFAQACKSRISRGFSFLLLAPCCTVLRSRWYQSGIKRLPVIRVKRCGKSVDDGSPVLLSFGRASSQLYLLHPCQLHSRATRRSHLTPKRYTARHRTRVIEIAARPAWDRDHD